jgi:hypothetical protein
MAMDRLLVDIRRSAIAADLAIVAVAIAALIGLVPPSGIGHHRTDGRACDTTDYGTANTSRCDTADDGTTDGADACTLHYAVVARADAARQREGEYANDDKRFHVDYSLER